MTETLLAALLVVGAIILGTLRSLVTSLLAGEVKAALAVWLDRRVDRAAMLLPPDEADDQAAEWRAELAAYGDRPLAAIRYALGLWHASLRIARLTGANGSASSTRRRASLLNSPVLGALLAGRLVVPLLGAGYLGLAGNVVTLVKVPSGTKQHAMLLASLCVYVVAVGSLSVLLLLRHRLNRRAMAELRRMLSAPEPTDWVAVHAFVNSSPVLRQAMRRAQIDAKRRLVRGPHPPDR
jgi:hypothetical protein